MQKLEKFKIQKQYEVISLSVELHNHDANSEIKEDDDSTAPLFSCEECKFFENVITISPDRWIKKQEELNDDDDEIDFNSTREYQDRNWVKSLFIIQTVRLGLESIPEEYYSAIKAAFEIPHLVGIMGGKKNKALFFVGHEGDNLIFLDPHIVQDAIPAKSIETFDLKSYT